MFYLGGTPPHLLEHQTWCALNGNFLASNLEIVQFLISLLVKRQQCNALHLTLVKNPNEVDAVVLKNLTAEQFPQHPLT